MNIKKGKKIVYKCIYEVMENMPQFAQEHSFQNALDWELKKYNIDFTSQKKIPINYKNEIFVGYFIPDVLINFKDLDLILELKRREPIDLDEVQIESYMSVYANKNIGILVNFREKTIKEYETNHKKFIKKYWCNYEKTFTYTPNQISDKEQLILDCIVDVQTQSEEPSKMWLKHRDILNITGLNKSTVHRALKKLKDNNLLLHEPDKGYQNKEPSNLF